MEIKLSPSASSRWLACPGSVLREAPIKEVTSKYAQEGIEAHSIAAKILEGGEVGVEVSPYILEYVGYIQQLKDLSTKHITFIEQKLKALDKNLNLTGTADYLLLDISNKHLHIIDLKYGKGIVVHAENNSQLLIYAFLAIEFLGFSHEIEKVTMHIHQPRIDHISTWTITTKELNKKMEEVCKIGKIALKENAAINPGITTCRFCKAKTTCHESLEFIKEQNNYLRFFDKI